ncbi:MAG: hypothetical protein AB1599_01260 [Planctomycetota bacterium]
MMYKIIRPLDTDENSLKHIINWHCGINYDCWKLHSREMADKVISSLSQIEGKSSEEIEQDVVGANLMLYGSIRKMFESIKEKSGFDIQDVLPESTRIEIIREALKSEDTIKEAFAGLSTSELEMLYEILYDTLESRGSEAI